MILAMSSSHKILWVTKNFSNKGLLGDDIESSSKDDILERYQRLENTKPD